jgi:hypothetical protein
MTQLSPAAKAVIDATWQEIDHVPLSSVYWAAAAALRAVADQVVPETPKPSGNSDWDLHHWTLVLDSYYQRKNTRVQILAIATELEAL